MREPANRCAASADATTFCVHVPTGSPVEPNFWPAIQSTEGAAGSAATAAGSARSARRVCTPWACNALSVAVLEKRDTAITRRVVSAMARRAIRATVGPIFPPAPNTSTSPWSAANALMVCSSGAESRDSSAGSLVGASGGMATSASGHPGWFLPHR